MVLIWRGWLVTGLWKVVDGMECERGWVVSAGRRWSGREVSRGRQSSRCCNRVVGRRSRRRPTLDAGTGRVQRWMPPIPAYNALSWQKAVKGLGLGLKRFKKGVKRLGFKGKVLG